MLKYCYFRRSPPKRDWLPDPAVNLLKADFGTHYYPGPMGSVRNSKFAVVRNDNVPQLVWSLLPLCSAMPLSFLCS